MQARDEAVRDELATNAANAHERAQLIAAALRDLGGVPDVITPVLGRPTALAKTVVEQGQPIAAALFGDLALEHQLLEAPAILRPSPTQPTTPTLETWRGACRLHIKKPSSGSPRCSSKKPRGSPLRTRDKII